MLSGILDPPSTVFKRDGRGHIVNEDAADRVSIVAARDTPELFLACGVPNLQLYRHVLRDVDHFAGELHAQSHLVLRVELVLEKAL